jgi:hypothetical protein
MNAAASWGASAARRMRTQKLNGRLPNRGARVHLVPFRGELRQALERLSHRCLVECAVPFQPIAKAHSTSVAHPTSVAASLAVTICAARVVVSVISNGMMADNGGRVREVRQPSRRSSINARGPDALPLGRAGFVAKIPLGTVVCAGRTTPSRTSLARRPSSSDRKTLTGSRRTTGRPRSTINTSAPPLTLSINALMLFLASVMRASLYG